MLLQTLKEHGITSVIVFAFFFIPVTVNGSETKPVLIGIDAEFGLENSISAQAIELGVRIAASEINAAGGVLNGRPIGIVTKDHRSIPARGIQNIKELAAIPDLVAVIGGRFSPVILDQIPVIKEKELPFIAVWSSADPIIDNGMSPNYVFRVSLRDSLAMPKLLQYAHRRGINEVGLLITNTSWGRSNRIAADKYQADGRPPRIVQTVWYHWQDKSLVEKYQALLRAGAKAVILVGNDDEGSLLLTEIAALPAEQRVPIISHWGIAGGVLTKQASAALKTIDLTVIQTFSFFNAEPQPLERFMQAAARFGIHKIEDIKAPVGVAHAYDATHILARAINLAGTTNRAKVRSALEKIREHRGLIKHYKPPFTADRHEALGPSDVLMARYRSDGVLVRVEK